MICLLRYSKFSFWSKWPECPSSLVVSIGHPLWFQQYRPLIPRPPISFTFRGTSEPLLVPFHPCDLPKIYLPGTSLEHCSIAKVFPGYYSAAAPDAPPASTHSVLLGLELVVNTFDSRKTASRWSLLSCSYFGAWIHWPLILSLHFMTLKVFCLRWHF